MPAGIYLFEGDLDDNLEVRIIDLLNSLNAKVVVI